MLHNPNKGLLILMCLVLYLGGSMYGIENSIINFGEPNKAELLMRRWEKDTTAEAAILYEKEDIEFSIDNASGHYQIISTYHCRLKIFKKSALDRGTIKIRLFKRNGSEESVDYIKGTTYNYENGNVVTSKLTKEMIFKENVSEFEMITKITAPNLKESSIFEYSYTTTTPFTISSKPKTWSFQGNIPFKWSEVSVVIPRRFFYKIFYHGYLPISIQEERDTVVRFGTNDVEAVKYRYAVKDAPAFVNEVYTNTFKDCISKMEFELASYADPKTGQVTNYSLTWGQINNTLLRYENFGEKLKNTSFLKEISAQFESLDTLEKIKAAFAYISKTIKWNGYFNMYTSESLNKVFENKIGSGAQINMILVALLRRLRIEANPAIISTIDNGEIKEEYPLLEKFNYCIAQARVGGQDILMDAAEKFASPGILPYQCLSKKAFIIEKENGRLIPCQPRAKMVKIEMMDYVIHPEENVIKGNFKASYGGYLAMQTRRYIDKEGEKEEIEKIKKDNPDWELENIKIERKDSVYEPLEIKFNFSNTMSNTGAGTIYFNPLFSHKHNKNPFKDTTRIYPVDFNVATEDVILITLKIPTGYKIENMPESESFVLPDKAGRFSYTVEVQNDLIKIKSQFSLNKTFFTPKEYYNLKEFYNVVVDKQAQQIMLRKL